MNKLFNKLTKVLRKQYGPHAGVVPFSLGRIYQCQYRNWHHDPRPLLLIVGSDAFYTVGINIHYLGPHTQSLMTYIMLMRQSNTVLTGYAIYKVMKARYPMIVKLAFRKYFTSMLRGKLVSEGISTAPEKNVHKWLAEPFAKKLNNMLHPPMFSRKRPPSIDPKDARNVRSQIIQTQYYKDRSKPFANRRQSNMVQYRQENNN